MFPSRNGMTPTGTQMTQRFSAHQDRLGICSEVGNCLADIVDAVDNIAEGKLQNERFSEPFNIPPPPPGFDHEALEKAKQMEEAKRNELNALALRQRSVEDERNKAWKRMLKVKAENNMPQNIYSASGQYRAIQLDINNYSRLPVPSLHQCHSLEGVPQVGGQHENLASFTPSERMVPGEHGDPASNKYSLSATRARVAAIAAISVAPAAPKPKEEEKKKSTRQSIKVRKQGKTL